MNNQKFEVLAVPKKTAYSLTSEQIKQLEKHKENSSEDRKNNARLLQKLNINKESGSLEDSVDVEFELER